MTIPTQPLPTVGQPNSTEDPKVRSALSELQTILTAGVDTTNLAAAAGITGAQVADATLTAAKLASAVQAAAGLNGASTRRGKSIIATEESRTSTAYGTLATPDQVSSIVMPTDGLICVAYHALWKESAVNTGNAAIFLGGNQLQYQGSNPTVQRAQAFNRTTANVYTALSTYPAGLHTPTHEPITTADPATTGMLVGHSNFAAGDEFGYGICHIFAAAGTYNVSVQFKSSSGTVTVKNRRLWVWSMGFD